MEPPPYPKAVFTNAFYPPNAPVLTDETAPQLLRRNLEANDALLTPHTSVKELDWDDFTPDACALSDSTAHVVAAFSHTEPPRVPPLLCVLR